jgi:hypothetical protein
MRRSAFPLAANVNRLDKDCRKHARNQHQAVPASRPRVCKPDYEPHSSGRRNRNHSRGRFHHPTHPVCLQKGFQKFVAYIYLQFRPWRSNWGLFTTAGRSRPDPSSANQLSVSTLDRSLGWRTRRHQHQQSANMKAVNMNGLLAPCTDK